MRMKYIALFFAPLFFLNGCDEDLIIPQQPVPDDFGISLILYSNRLKQVGVISKTVDPARNILDDTTHFYPHAALLVDDTPFSAIPNDSLYLRKYRDRDFTYNYYTDSMTIVSGQTYRLHLDLGNGSTITGQTIVPQGIEPDAVTESEYYYYVSWHGPDSLSYSWILWANAGTPEHPDWSPFIRGYSGHETYARIKKKSLMGFSQFYMYVHTYDLNYTNYVTEKRQTSGLSGGYGVFGSIKSDGFWVTF